MKKKFFCLLTSVFALTLASCTFQNVFSSKSLNPYTSSQSEDPEYFASTYENFAKRSISNVSYIPTSVQNPKILVIPIWFTNSGIAINDKNQTLDTIAKAFKGTNTETGWYSVKTFYEEESHGLSVLDISVSDWFECNHPSSDYKKDDDCSKTINLGKEAINWYFNKTGEQRSEYDTDGDGYLDGVCFIYGEHNYVYSSQESNNFWAYTFWARNKNTNIQNPVLNGFMWASFDFTEHDNQGGMIIDAHTYIHEVGHLYGLDDYYDYNHAGYSAAGQFTMQDKNIGGHDPFSLIALGWVNPIIPTKGNDYVINSFAENGDVLLLHPTTYTSAFDEYILIELYSPIGTNEHDTKYHYGRTDKNMGYDLGPTISGIRVWHIDARLVRSENGNYYEKNITNKIKKDTSAHYNFVCTNNTYTNQDDNEKIITPFKLQGNYFKYKLIQEIRRNDFTCARGGVTIRNEDLFLSGDDINISNYGNSNYFIENSLFNNKQSLNLGTIHIKSINSVNHTATVSYN